MTESFKDFKSFSWKYSFSTLFDTNVILGERNFIVKEFKGYRANLHVLFLDDCFIGNEKIFEIGSLEYILRKHKIFNISDSCFIEAIIL